MVILQPTAIKVQLVEEKASIVMPDGGKIAQILLLGSMIHVEYKAGCVWLAVEAALWRDR